MINPVSPVIIRTELDGPTAILWRTTSIADLGGGVGRSKHWDLLIMFFPRGGPTNSGTSIYFLVHRGYRIGDGTGWFSSMQLAKKMSYRSLSQSDSER